MTTRITETFARLRTEQRAALVGYLTAFDPDLERSREQLFVACEAGLDVLEIGIPFSDPTADGPAVQGAMVRALQAGARTQGVLELAADIRARFEVPIVLFSYANPLFQYGPELLVREAARAGVDGLLVVDLPPEHATTLRAPAREAGLDWVSLVAPTTPEPRLVSAVEAATGFVYAVTLRGTTGAHLDTEDPALREQFARIRAHTSLPVVAGFGVRTPEQAESLGDHVDGVVVGSALIEAAQRGKEELRTLVASLRAALDEPTVVRA